MHAFSISVLIFRENVLYFSSKIRLLLEETELPMSIYYMLKYNKLP